jgi:hypothetical protein
MEYFPALGHNDHRRAVRQEDSSFQETHFGVRIAMVANDRGNQKEPAGSKFTDRRAKI